METPAERDLPDDVEALKALLLAKQAETEQLHAEIAERKAIKAADDIEANVFRPIDEIGEIGASGDSDELGMKFPSDAPAPGGEAAARRSIVSNRQTASLLNSPVILCERNTHPCA